MSTTALIEEYDPVAAGVVKAAHCATGASTGPAMQQNNWDASGIAAFLEIDLVTIANVEMTVTIRFDWRVEIYAFAEIH